MNSNDVLPESLVALTQMILGGNNIKNQTDNHSELTGSVSSLTQLLVFNAVKRTRTERQFMRHNLERETLLPLYVGLLIHSKTRNRELMSFLRKDCQSLKTEFSNCPLMLEIGP